MPETIGKCACPLCGADAEVKINKNNKLYSFCDYGCSIKLSSIASKKALEELKKGKMTKQGRLTITPLNFEMKGENNNDGGVAIERRGGNNAGNDEQSGNDTGGDSKPRNPHGWSFWAGDWD